MAYRRYHGGSDSSLGSFLSGCLTGMVIGGVLGVLLAPHRGDITRRKIARKAGETKDQVGEAVEDQIAAFKAKKEAVEEKLEAFTEEQEAQNGDEETDS